MIDLDKIASLEGITDLPAAIAAAAKIAVAAVVAEPPSAPTPPSTPRRSLILPPGLNGVEIYGEGYASIRDRRGRTL